MQVGPQVQEELENHLEEGHREQAPEGGFKCSICNYILDSEENTRRHMTSNQQVKERPMPRVEERLCVLDGGGGAGGGAGRGAGGEAG